MLTQNPKNGPQGVGHNIITLDPKLQFSLDSILPLLFYYTTIPNFLCPSMKE